LKILLEIVSKKKQDSDGRCSGDIRSLVEVPLEQVDGGPLLASSVLESRKGIGIGQYPLDMRLMRYHLKLKYCHAHGIQEFCT